jgi:hypothetical protein
MSQGYMTMAKLATCRVPEDPASPTPAGDTSWHARHSTSKDSVCITPISLLSAAVLQPGAASLAPLGDLTHGGLRDPVRGLYWD